MNLVGPSAGRIGQKALLLLVEVIGRIYRFRKITMLCLPMGIWIVQLRSDLWGGGGGEWR